VPLILDKDRTPGHWAGSHSSEPATFIGDRATRADCIKIALINNMPDSALEDTESQFFHLLEAAAGDIPVHVELYSLPHLPRTDRGDRHLHNFYRDIDELWNKQFDGVIVTGTEPHQPNLRDEPYWPVMVDVLDWAEHNTVSTVLSCLAAHAGVLYSDGIHRHPLNDKQFGVFGYKKVSDHALTLGAPDLIQIPHSRWNEVRGDALVACGYVVLTQSPDAGVDLFVKNKGRSLFVHFQGHPEYEAKTLLKEYRRDVRRFLRRERETYPSMPHGYFDGAAAELLSAFRENALARPSEEVLELFPEAAVATTLKRSWQSSAALMYRNWLQYIASRTADASRFATAAKTGRAIPSARRLRDDDA
jgi:homoserine O-succinyltransferase/O-acetyltransferase